MVLLWSPKCTVLSVGPLSVLVLVWGQYYTGFSIGEATRIRVGVGIRPYCTGVGLPHKCLGFSVGPPSILLLVWNRKCLAFSVVSLLYWF